jgi:DNA-directed RNA polymerase specialized sigma subunit
MEQMNIEIFEKALSEFQNDLYLDDDEINKLIYLVQEGNPSAFERFIKANILFIFSTTTQLYVPGILLSDLFRSVSYAMLQAANTYTKSLNVRFYPFAESLIKDKISNEIYPKYKDTIPVLRNIGSFNRQDSYFYLNMLNKERELGHLSWVYDKITKERIEEEFKKVMDTSRNPIMSIGKILSRKKISSKGIDELKGILNDLKEQQNKYIEETENMSEEISRLTKKVTKYESILPDYFTNEFLNSFTEKKTSYKFMPVSIYIDSDNADQIIDSITSLKNLVDSLGFDICHEFDAERGSFFKGFWSKSKEIISSEEFQKRLAEAEHALKLKTITEKQSEIDKNQAEAVSNVIKANENVPNFAIRLGSLLIVKVTENGQTPYVVATNLSIEEMILLEKNPYLLRSPSDILDRLCLKGEQKQTKTAIEIEKNSS